VLVDEYQDTNHAQYVLCSLLAGGWRNFCVVGDDDQSIYKFRGATIENILDFEHQYKDAATIRLEQNYRSTGNILDAANNVIARNRGRKGKTLWTDQGAGDKIRLYSAENQDEEAQFIAKTIHKAFSEGGKLKDFTILYRNNALSNFLQTCFVRNGIPFAVVRGRSFLDSLEIRDMRAYLEVIHNPGDSVRLHRIINNPPRKIGAKTLETVALHAMDEGRTEFDIICEADKYTDLSRGSAALLKFGQMISALRALKDQVSLVELYDAMLEQSGYRLALEAQGTQEAQGRLENIQELKSNMVDYQKRCEEAGDVPTLEGFLEELSLISDVDKYDENADVVTMMTMHSAKGLEFPKVFIVGAEDGLFPSYRSMESEEEMEEERRLCYVAMTRAKRELYITSSKRRMLYGQTTYGKPSRFIEEIPPELIEEVETRPQRPAYGQQTGGWQRGGTVAWQQGTPQRETKRMAAPSPSFASKPSPAPEFRAGMAVRHKAFGPGVVKEVTPMGGDLLLRIEFDKAGEKLMMAKTAAKFMQKA
jgi:DNA helicase-2/ATP-dependent DNA helicase PcrA